MYTLVTIPPILEIIAGGLAYFLIARYFFTGIIHKDYVDWHQLNEAKLEDADLKRRPYNIIVSVASALFTATILANLLRIEHFAPQCWCDVVGLATWIWAGFAACNQFNTFLFEPTKVRVLLYNLFYRWLSITAQALAIYYVRGLNINTSAFSASTEI